MKIPKEFKDAIKSVMYDKKIEPYTCVETTNEELEVVRKKGTKLGEFAGNIRPTSGDIALKEFGLDISADYLITTEENEELNEDKFISYKGKDYSITGILKYDSHFKIFIKGID